MYSILGSLSDIGQDITLFGSMARRQLFFSLSLQSLLHSCLKHYANHWHSAKIDIDH